jgi:molybdopterin-guanine dinucleotide biosynthesis protein A
VLAGRTLLQRAIDATNELAERYVIVTAKGQQVPAAETSVSVRGVEDVYAETGPLGGIYSGLVAIADGADTPPLRERGGGRGEGSHALVVACDMPLLQPALLRELLRLAPGHDAVVPTRDGLPEPLCAVYSTACIEPARLLLERGVYKVAGILDGVDALLVPEAQWRPFDPEGLSFLNVNREADLEQAKALIERGEM